MVLSSERVVPISGDEDGHKIGKLADFILSHTNPGFVFVCFAFAISMVLKSFSCSSNNQLPFTVLRTNELKMAKAMVVAINGKTHASQLSGSPRRLHLQTISVFKVYPGKRITWLFVRAKRVFIPPKTAYTSGPGNVVGSLGTEEPTSSLVEGVHFGLLAHRS